MKHNKLFLFAVLPTLAVSFISGCNSNNNKKSSTPAPISEEEEKPLEVGDTVREWSDDDTYDELPLNLPASANDGTGEGKIVRDLGSDDNISLKYDVKVGNNNQGYITSETAKKPYFLYDDAKNGDIISFYYYVPANSNLATLQLQVMPGASNNPTPINGEVITINADKEEKWIRTLVSYDTLELLGSIRVAYAAVDENKSVSFYIDEISIIYGEETVKTDYVYNNENLAEAYEDKLIIGACMSDNQVKNSEMRKIVKDNFNSITAENEGKPERILDQEGCQELAKSDKTAVAIKTSPFEKIYSFCEANHIGVRHHTFVWYSQTPEWFFNEDYTTNTGRASRETMLKRMENFIKVTMETLNDRWPGLVYAFDVVNEAVGNGGAGYNKGNKWYDTVGEDFVYQAFKFADMYKDEDQDLYYNDYDYDYNVSNCDFALNTILKDAIKDGFVDGVGIQGHIDSDQNMDVVINDAKMIKEKGLKCQITELDITVSGSDDAAWKKQKGAYKLLLSRILESNAKEETDVNAVIVWGITDNTSWKSYQNPLLFTSSYAKKPCYYGMLEAIEEFK